MAEDQVVTIEQPKRLSVRDEIAILRTAVERAPSSPRIRLKLAHLYAAHDAFDDAIALLDVMEKGERGSDGTLLLAKALFARETKADDRRALTAARLGNLLANNDEERAIALADEAKAAFRQGNASRGVKLLEQALDLDPACRSAFKRLSRHLLLTRQASQALELCERLWTQGVFHTRILAARTAAFAQSGRLDEARIEAGHDRHIKCENLAAPDGWADITTFNRDLAAELLSNPGLCFEQAGVASRRTWRVESPLLGRVPAVAALLRLIARRIEVFSRSVEATNRWSSLRPDKAMLQCWAVHPEPTGYERWHLHPHGWLSGGYYVAVPPEVRTASDEAGCLAFGLPPGVASRDGSQAFGRTIIRPTPGLLTLFPSHAYHRTFPHRADSARICLAFDLVPDSPSASPQPGQ